MPLNLVWNTAPVLSACCRPPAWGRVLVYALLTIGSLAVVLRAPGAAAQVPTGEWSTAFSGPAVNGPVHALAQEAGRVYVGGAFTWAGPNPAGSVAVFDRVDGRWESLGGGVDGVVDALAIGGDGTVYVGGRFGRAGGNTASNIARYDPVSGRWSPLEEGVDGAVSALAVGADGALYVGGRFDSAGGAPAPRLARWAGGEWTALGRPTCVGVSPFVSALAVYDGSLYVGGRFDSIGGRAAHSVARLDPTTGAWAPLSGGVTGGAVPHVRAIIPTAEGVYVGGDFSVGLRPDGQRVPMENVGRWDWETGAWNRLGDGLPLTSALALGADGVLYAAAGGPTGPPLWRWTGTEWAGVPSAPGGDGAGALLRVEDELFVGFGGTFYSTPEDPLGFLYTLGSEGWGVPADAGAGGLTGPVYALSPAPHAPNSAYAVGAFSFAGDREVGNAALWSRGRWSPLGGGVDGRALAVVGVEEGAYVGGSFTMALQSGGGSLATGGIVLWDTGLARWRPLGGGTTGAVYAISAVPDGAVVAGHFDAVVQPDGQVLLTPSVARWEARRARWTSLPDGHGLEIVNAMAVDEAGALYLGGYDIVEETLEARGRVSRLAGGSDDWAVLNEWAYSPVLDIAVEGSPSPHDPNGGSLWVAAGTAQVWSWDGGEWTSRGGAGYATAVEVGPGGTALAGGRNGAPLQHWDGASWKPFGGGVRGLFGATVLDLDVHEGHVWLAGHFSEAGGVPSTALAMWTSSSVGQSPPPPPESAGFRVFPNPASSSVMIEVGQDRPGDIAIEFVDGLGRRAVAVWEGTVGAGSHAVSVDTDSLPAGQYWIRLHTPSGTRSRGLTIVH